MRKDKDTQKFGGPVVDPRVQDPAALAYARDIQARKGTENRYTTPVGGEKTPPIPRLDLPAQEGMTMADQARAAAAPVPGSTDPSTSIFPHAPIISQAAQTTPEKQGMTRPPNYLLPQDILPEAARKDSDFREGQGSMYAASQPHLAYKYGVIRNKTLIPPQRLTGGTGGLSQQTVEGLKAAQEFQKTRERVETGADEAVTGASSAGPGGAAEIAGGAEPLSDEDRKKVRRAVDQMDDFDWNTFKQMTMKDILNNEDQKKIIETRVSELSVDDLIMNGHVRQRVPIRPGKFEPTFQSLSADEELACKRLLVADAKALDVSDQYLLDKQSFMQVCCGLHMINNTVMPSHRDEQGNFNDTKFWAKFNQLIKYPLHMLASLGINFFWFEVRVRKLFVADALGNG